MDEVPISTVVASIGFLLGGALGAAARYARFCTLGAIADAYLTGDHRRWRAWMLAIAVAVLIAQTLHHSGIVDLRQSIYLTPDFGWLGAIAGGLAFGFGMALCGTCGYGILVRLGGGDLRAFLTFVVLGIFAYMTLRGLTGVWREALVEPTNIDLQAVGSQSLIDATAWLSGAAPEGWLRPVGAGLVVLGLAAYCFRDEAFRSSSRDVTAGLLVGGCVGLGWLVTGVVGFDAFEPAPLESFSFVAPLGESLVYLMTFSGSTISFGIASVGGVIAGAYLVALAKGEFRIEGFEGGRDMLRYILGGALMGVGGVLALGCTVGQGISGMSTLSLSAPLALASIVLGASFGLRYLEERNVIGAAKVLFLRR